MVELYNHNAETYRKVQDVLKRDHRVAIVQATGTGKSFITMKLMQEDYADMKKLYVVPKTAIKENVMLYPEWSQHNTDFITYVKLTKLDITKVIESYDVFVFDEVHHACASTWSIPVRAILKSGKICIGLTATPLRHDGIDSTKELFGDSVVYGPDAVDAIERGIWSEFKYVLTVNKIYERLYEAKRKVDELPVTIDTLAYKTASAGISLDDASSYAVRNILQANKVTGGKWLVFCSSVDQLSAIQDDIRDWFGYQDITVLQVSGRMSKNQQAQTIQEFNRYLGTAPIVLASVDVLTEGMHLSRVSGIIMLRRTQSLPVFLQMIGRAMTTDRLRTPLIIDVADNLTMLKAIFKSSMSLEDTVTKGSDLGGCTPKSGLMLSRELSIQTALLVSMEEFIESVNSINPDSIWTEDELRTLRRYYPHAYGHLTKSKIAIRKKAVELGLVKPVKWSVQEDETLKANYPTLGIKVASLLKDKSQSEIRNRVRYLHLRYTSHWSFDEDELVLRGKIPEGRTDDECRKRAEVLRRKFT